jgi:hypothetical protein
MATVVYVNVYEVELSAKRVQASRFSKPVVKTGKE